jgi:hypothetical protein
MSILPSPTKCVICRSKIIDGEVLTLECGHLFHTDCIMQGCDDKCPLCRQLSERLAQDEGLKCRKLERQNDAKQEQIIGDEQLAQRLQREELRPEIQPVDSIVRGEEEWNGAVQTIVMWLAEMMCDEDNPLERYDSLDDRKRVLHGIFHEQGAFLTISCGDLCEIAGDALQHEMFRME